LRLVQDSNLPDWKKILEPEGFKNDTSEGAPICRWIYKDIKVDVMPTDSSVLGFSNRWYEEGLEIKIQKTLSDGTDVFLFPPEYYLAAKFEAHKGRQAAVSATARKLGVIIWTMITKKVQYQPPTEYLFLDQKRKLKVMQRIKKNIAKFDIKPEDVGFCNSLNMSYDI